MSVENLIKALASIRQRIDSHGDHIAEKETRTRQILIDPLLKTLGWDASDPTQVILEYPIRVGGRQPIYADYALLHDGKPIAVVEAKRLRRQLDDHVISQVLNYATGHGIKYMLATNGDEWRMYDVFKQVPLAEKIKMQFQLTKQSLYFMFKLAEKLEPLQRTVLIGGFPAATPPVNPEQQNANQRKRLLRQQHIECLREIRFDFTGRGITVTVTLKANGMFFCEQTGTYARTMMDAVNAVAQKQLGRPTVPVNVWDAFKNADGKSPDEILLAHAQRG